MVLVEHIYLASSAASLRVVCSNASFMSLHLSSTYDSTNLFKNRIELKLVGLSVVQKEKKRRKEKKRKEKVENHLNKIQCNAMSM